MSSGHSEQPTAGELRAFAFRLLSRREYSVFELDQRIRGKWPRLDSAAIEALLESLVTENLLSDQRFAEAFVRACMNKSQGPLKIRAALRARGVPELEISCEVERHAGQWTALAADWLRRQHPGKPDFDARGKYYRRLLNRGFSHDQAMDALNSL